MEEAKRPWHQFDTRQEEEEEEEEEDEGGGDILTAQHWRASWHGVAG